MKISHFLHRIKSRIIKKKDFEAQVLTLPEALRLASILNSKIDVETLDPRIDAVDFIGDILDKLSPEEYIDCVMLLTRENEENIKKHISIEILTALIEGLRKNQVVTLLGFYKSLDK